MKLTWDNDSEKEGGMTEKEICEFLNINLVF